ncbi:histone H4 [Schizosaccharomyces japonicus yFS275]|uniref:Histone H4 n=1 Tax=Schizosaccharomyces japonicus (strain yFS275 / FY16936) TaxID=402676 RepID=B6K2P7_SCHJY|nr:histone H4 [Schizosaccharomyces japonicus yFS275]EEB07428.1 histone H4 [Schizosaccharomyces japonicus yFS275]
MSPEESPTVTSKRISSVTPYKKLVGSLSSKRLYTPSSSKINRASLKGGITPYKQRALILQNSVKKRRTLSSSAGKAFTKTPRDNLRLLSRMLAKHPEPSPSSAENTPLPSRYSSHAVDSVRRRLSSRSNSQQSTPIRNRRNLSQQHENAIEEDAEISVQSIEAPRRALNNRLSELLTPDVRRISSSSFVSMTTNKQAYFKPSKDRLLDVGGDDDIEEPVYHVSLSGIEPDQDPETIRAAERSSLKSPIFTLPDDLLRDDSLPSIRHEPSIRMSASSAQLSIHLDEALAEEQQAERENQHVLEADQLGSPILPPLDDEQQEIPSLHDINISPSAFPPVETIAESAAAPQHPNDPPFPNPVFRVPKRTHANDCFLPTIAIRKLAHRFSSRKLSASAMDHLVSISNKFMSQMLHDLETYADHASRKTINSEDVILLLKRQRKITKKTSLEALALQYLPRELVASVTQGKQKPK